MNKRRFPSLYIPHGAGPCFFMDWTMGPADTWDKMAAWLRQVGASVSNQSGAKPDAVVVFSAHWENEVVTINSSATPALYFDYYNFPPHTYELTYPAPGHPALATVIEDLLTKA
ncbi:MAG: dioxygenase, partial [Piscirickettsiaceae bacterium]